jgi:hypothetical protein
VPAQEEMNSILNADQENNEAFSMAALSPARVGSLATDGTEVGNFSCEVNERDMGLQLQLSVIGSREGATLENHKVMKKGGSMVAKGKQFVLENTIALAVKRSKRRGGSVDEDSSVRAERLKAKKNLDDPGRSKTKSFLSFSDSKIVSNIAMLGVSIGKDIGKNIEDMKETELDRLLQASYNTPNQEDMSQNVDDETSEAESDVGLD